MLIQIEISDGFVVLSEWEQEFITGGSAPQINNNNFAQRTGTVTGNNSSGPQGNTTETNTQFAEINSGSQSIMSSDVLGLNSMGGMGNVAPNNLSPVGSPMRMF